MEFQGAKTTSEVEIANMEAALSHSFPEAYRKHLLRYDGGRPAMYYFDYQRDNEIWEGEIWRFYCVSHCEHCNLQSNSEVFAGRMPEEFFPVACNSGGDQYIMGKPGTEFEGKIYIWEHEFEADVDEPPSWENIHLIANSIDEFLGMLRPFREDDE